MTLEWLLFLDFRPRRTLEAECPFCYATGNSSKRTLEFARVIKKRSLIALSKLILSIVPKKPILQICGEIPHALSSWKINATLSFFSLTLCCCCCRCRCWCCCCCWCSCCCWAPPPPPPPPLSALTSCMILSNSPVSCASLCLCMAIFSLNLRGLPAAPPTPTPPPAAEAAAPGDAITPAEDAVLTSPNNNNFASTVLLAPLYFSWCDGGYYTMYAAANSSISGR